MIRVNLLPQEYRKSEGTPLKVFFSVIGAVVLAVASFAYWGYMNVVVVGDATKSRDKLQLEVDGQKNKVQYSKDLAAQLAEYEGRYKKIDEVAADRLVLSRKIDEIWEMVVRPKSPRRYEVWLSAFTISVQGGARAPNGGTASIGGMSAGAQIKPLVDFHEALTESDFFQDFEAITPPYAGNLEQLVGDDREPKSGRSFQFQMILKNLETLYTDREERDKAEAEGTAEGTE